MTYNMQEIFNIEGYFSMYITPPGANMCLLEDIVEGEMQNLTMDRKKWLKHWFKEVHPQRSINTDDEKVMWIKCYGIPIHAWKPKLFESLVS